MNRSEELARLLGIEPKNACLWISNGIKTCISEGYKCTKEKCNNGYPDFTQPDNFVKLLTIIYKEWGWIEIQGDGINNNFIDDFINICITELKTINNDFDKYPAIKTIITNAQQTEWTY